MLGDQVKYLNMQFPKVSQIVSPASCMLLISDLTVHSHSENHILQGDTVYWEIFDKIFKGGRT